MKLQENTMLEVFNLRLNMVTLNKLRVISKDTEYDENKSQVIRDLIHKEYTQKCVLTTPDGSLAVK